MPDKNYLPYSHQRVKQILHEDYHIRLHPIVEYKGNRKPNYVKKYHMINEDTEEIILPRVTLNAIRKILTQESYPLKETIKPCKGAIEFLKYVEEHKKTQS